MLLAAPRSDPEKSSRRGTNNDLYKEWKYPVSIQMLIAERLLNVQVEELAEAVVIEVAHCTKAQCTEPPKYKCNGIRRSYAWGWEEMRNA